MNLGLKGTCFSWNIFFLADLGTVPCPTLLYSNRSLTLKEAEEILIRDHISLGLHPSF